MSAKVVSACSDAMESSLVVVESSVLRGFAGLQLIGNTTEVCRNGLERAKAALENSGISLPQRRIVVSLAPADLKKDGSQCDLAMALSLALLLGPNDAVIDNEAWLFVAELSLDGQLRPVKNIISFAVAAAQHGLRGMVIAPENLQEVRTLTSLQHKTMKNLQVLAFGYFREALAWVWGEPTYELDAATSVALPGFANHKAQLPKHPNFDDMILPPELYQAALVTATGLHSLLLYGTPGTGKSMFSARINSILPPLSKELHLDVLRIHSSLSQHIPQAVLAAIPPFRAPHHQASAAAILGVPETPGEVSLAHGGILFLDEFPEFRRDIIESLREPLETGHVRVSRARHKVSWKSRITLIAACNLCPCGWYGSTKKRCACPTAKILAYRRKVSGPILDRIDMHLNLCEAKTDQADFFLQVQRLQKDASQTEAMRARVAEARAFGAARNSRWSKYLNSELNAGELLEASGLSDADFAELLKQHAPLHASQRSLVRSLRVARTLADLAQRANLDESDIVQASRWQPEAAAHARGDYALGLT